MSPSHALHAGTSGARTASVAPLTSDASLHADIEVFQNHPAFRRQEAQSQRKLQEHGLSSRCDGDLVALIAAHIDDDATGQAIVRLSSIVVS